MEVDAIIENNGLVCIEIKTGAERDYPSISKTVEDTNVSRRIVIEKGNIFIDGDGIEHYPLFAAAFLFPEKEQKIDETELQGLLGDPFEPMVAQQVALDSRT